METTTARNNWNGPRKLMLVVGVLVFTWVYKNTGVYDGAATFLGSITILACVHSGLNGLNMKLKTLTPNNFLFLRFSDVVLIFLVCVCMTLETLILHRPFTF